MQLRPPCIHSGATVPGAGAVQSCPPGPPHHEVYTAGITCSCSRLCHLRHGAAQTSRFKLINDQYRYINNMTVLSPGPAASPVQGPAQHAQPGQTPFPAPGPLHVVGPMPGVPFPSRPFRRSHPLGRGSRLHPSAPLPALLAGVPKPDTRTPPLSAPQIIWEKCTSDTEQIDHEEIVTVQEDSVAPAST